MKLLLLIQICNQSLHEIEIIEDIEALQEGRRAKTQGTAFFITIQRGVS